ncbi:hypothetical protein NQ534_12775 [Marvinbryantia formatexigens DSM 14469]|uniref:hypothetical protein n=1 Tax=Marvinbryantia formatexigens TaxID=168384 RepID=UPI0011607403|nr:hypothetical protein [Marvinbryantia formatexigens]UWO23326.1 hypothetical protein NQ534_12775 [Marvinbryantia formatexigens DSM 14469]
MTEPIAISSAADTLIFCLCCAAYWQQFCLHENWSDKIAAAMLAKPAKSAYRLLAEAWQWIP